MKLPISVVLATYNEATNITRCLESVKDIASEIVIVDGGSTDDTVALAKLFGAKVIKTTNPPIFHINKQKALDEAKYDWVLQLDADEVVSDELAHELVQLYKQGIGIAQKHMKLPPLFARHMKLLEARDGAIGDKSGNIVAYFIPRKNYFLGGPITHGGTYPDGVIRLVNRKHVHFPCKSVHEQIVISGDVAWCSGALLHYSNPTLNRYIAGAQKYTALLAIEMKKNPVKPSPISYLMIFPMQTFFALFFRHKGFLDGWRGLLFAFFSACHFPFAYFTYLKTKHT